MSKIATKAKKIVRQEIRDLSAFEVITVSGGINPQPLPPCHASKLK